MNIQSVDFNNIQSRKNQNSDNRKSPSFKGVGDTMISVMDFIDRGGLFASFTIQDMTGTNFPRTYVGLQRNKDITGENNYKEAAEVGIREFVTGPSMFAVPMVILAGSKKFIGKSLDVPCEVLNGFGSILKETNITDPKNLKTNKDEFYNEVFKKVLKSTSPSAKDYEIATLATNFTNLLQDYENANSMGFVNRLRNKKVNGSKEDIMEKMMSSYIDFVKKHSDIPEKTFQNVIYSKNGKNIFSTSFERFLGNMTDYTQDITEKFSKQSEIKNFKDYIDPFTKSRIGGRFLLNAGMLASIMGFCTIIPKLYMRSSEFPGAAGLKEASAKNVFNENENNKNEDKANPSFKGLGDLGNKVTKTGILNKISKVIEFVGYNMPVSVLAGVCFISVLLPRMLFARDKDEFKEIVLRDFITIMTLCFGSKVLQNTFVKMLSKKTGLALSKNPEGHESASIFKRAFNYVRPEAGIKVFNGTELKSKYIDIDKYKNGIVDFTKFIQKNDGSVSKLFKLDETLKNMTKKAYEQTSFSKVKDFDNVDDKTLIDAFKELNNKKSDLLNPIYEYFRKPDNNILKKARTINSGFDFVSTLVLVPAFLGFLLPKINEKILKDKYLKNNSNQQTNNQEIKNIQTDLNKIDKKDIQTNSNIKESEKIDKESAKKSNFAFDKFHQLKNNN